MAEHFIAVIYDGAWKYDSNSAYYTFTPTNTDVLVADVDLSANTVSDLAGQRGMYYGVAYGYAGGERWRWPAGGQQLLERDYGHAGLLFQ